MEAPASVSALLDAPLSRRGFLVRSAGLAATLSLGELLAPAGDAYATLLLGEDPPEALPVREYAVLRAVAARLVPGGPSHPGANQLRVAARIDRELSYHPRLREDVIDGLRLVEWWPLATRLSCFTRLSVEAQDAELAAMPGSRFAFRRSAFQGIRFLVMFFHYTQDAAWAGTGYDGPWVPRVRPPSVA